MQIVGFMEDEVQSVLELVAAVLKLGNIEFKPESRCNGTDESRIKDKNGELDRRRKGSLDSVLHETDHFLTHFHLFNFMIWLHNEVMNT